MRGTSAGKPSSGSSNTPPQSGSGATGEKNGAYLEAPKLFNPNDRTAKRSIAPVHTAIYQQPVSYHQVSTTRTKVTAEQARQDAIGWKSVSN